MKKTVLIKSTLLMCLILLSLTLLPACASPKKLSPLHVEGTQLVDKKGKAVQLKGISTHGIAWYPEYINEECFRELKEDWGADIVRLAMYTAEDGGYLTDGNPEELKALIEKGVNLATENGMYVIIDWHMLHDGDPNSHVEEAAAFFDEMSAKFADYTNVLYEICNEPNTTDWNGITAYADRVIPVIRNNAPDAVVIVGTPSYSSLIMAPTYAPLSYDNVMYALHFYAATHRESIRKDLLSALEKGLPVFVSEYGICYSSGNGDIDYESAEAWAALLDENMVSSCAWNLSAKEETCALLKPGVSKTSGFATEDLSDSGRWVLNYLSGKDGL